MKIEYTTVKGDKKTIKGDNAFISPLNTSLDDETTKIKVNNHNKKDTIVYSYGNPPIVKFLNKDSELNIKGPVTIQVEKVEKTDQDNSPAITASYGADIVIHEAKGGVILNTPFNDATIIIKKINKCDCTIKSGKCAGSVIIKPEPIS